jgi:HSP20 family protein
MAIVRWNPLGLGPWGRFPRLFDEDSDWLESSRSLRIRETDKEIIAEAVVAGVPADKVNVNIEDGVLTIKASSEEKEEKKKVQRYQAYEYYYTAALAGGQWEKAKAEIEDGVLTVKIPKALAKPKKIQVTAKKALKEKKTKVK